LRYKFILPSIGYVVGSDWLKSVGKMVQEKIKDFYGRDYILSDLWNKCNNCNSTFSVGTRISPGKEGHLANKGNWRHLQPEVCIVMRDNSFDNLTINIRNCSTFINLLGANEPNSDDGQFTEKEWKRGFTKVSQFIGSLTDCSADNLDPYRNVLNSLIEVHNFHSRDHKFFESWFEELCLHFIIKCDFAPALLPENVNPSVMIWQSDAEKHFELKNNPEFNALRVILYQLAHGNDGLKEKLETASSEADKIESISIREEIKKNLKYGVKLDRQNIPIFYNSTSLPYDPPNDDN
jgi:hypothetical protein